MRLTVRLAQVAGVAVLGACGGGGGDSTTGLSSNTPPTAAFEFSCAELTCSFTDKSTDTEGSIVSWSWQFGDGGTSTDQNPVHGYATAQNYDVTLIVTDAAGAGDTTTQTAQPQAPSADLTCVDAATAGTSATCSLMLPQAASVQAVLSNRVPCQAHGDLFAFTAPVADTLTTDGCFDPIGTQVTAPSSPAGTQVALEIKSGLPQYRTGVRVTGAYPAWTLYVEDAVGAAFPENYSDMIVTLTAVPSGP